MFNDFQTSSSFVLDVVTDDASIIVIMDVDKYAIQNCPAKKLIFHMQLSIDSTLRTFSLSVPANRRDLGSRKNAHTCHV